MTLSRSKRALLPLIGAVLALGGLTLPTPAAAATYTSQALSATVNGSSVVAQTTVAANPATVAASYGVCVRSSQGWALDFIKATNVTLTTTGTAHTTAAKTFSPGTYTYFSCLKVGTTWYEPGVKKTFTVEAWSLVDSETFDTPAAAGTVNSVYDSLQLLDENAWYSHNQVSAAGGQLDIALSAGTGTAPGKGSRFILGPAASRWGQLYGRYEITYSATGASGHGSAFMLWPSDRDGCPRGGCWSDGEIDYPESGNFDGNQKLYHHPTPCDSDDGDAVPHCASSVQSDTGAGWRSTHTAVIEWTPGKVRYLMDGVLVREVVPTTQVALTGQGSTANVGVPSTPHRWTIQVTDNTGSNSAQAGHLLIDGFSIWSR